MVQWLEQWPLTKLCGPGLIPARCHMRVEFAVGSRLALRVFLRVLQFSSHQKNQHQKPSVDKFQFDRDRSRCGSSLNIVGNLFITQQNIREEIVFVSSGGS